MTIDVFFSIQTYQKDIKMNNRLLISEKDTLPTISNMNNGENKKKAQDIAFLWVESDLVDGWSFCHFYFLKYVMIRVTLND